MSQRSKRLFQKADVAYPMLDRAGKDRKLLPLPVRTFVLVYGAQGIIDNGGLQYFFESNFEDTPPYEEFCEAYREIGAIDVAEMLAEAVAMFTFEDPHLHADQRNSYLDSFWKHPDGRFAQIDSCLCGNESVWVHLDRYATRHAAAFVGRS